MRACIIGYLNTGIRGRELHPTMIIQGSYNDSTMPDEVVARITVFCFAASYAVALALELLQLRRPRPIQRVLSLAFGSAGLLAHTIYVARPLPLAAPRSS